MHYRDRLKEILCEKSIRRGDTFVLTSGKTSNYYVDCKPATLDPEGAYCTGMVVLDVLKQITPYPKAIGGLTLGADPIVPVVAALSYQQGAPVSAFIVRKEAKKHGTARYLEGWQGQRGEPVVIIDDVCTTGGSTLIAIERAQQAGLEVVAAICLVDRDEGGREAIQKICPFHAVFPASELLAALPAKHNPVTAS